jgi:hypothetical protein
VDVSRTAVSCVQQPAVFDLLTRTSTGPAIHYVYLSVVSVLIQLNIKGRSHVQNPTSAPR